MATTLFDRVFKGSDEMYDVAVKALEEASAKYPDSEPIASGHRLLPGLHLCNDRSEDHQPGRIKEHYELDQGSDGPSQEVA